MQSLGSAKRFCAIILASSFMASCGGQPPFTIYDLPSPSPTELIVQADVIFVGVILGSKWTTHKLLFQDRTGPFSVRGRIVNVKIETILRGTFSTRDVDLERYDCDRDCGSIPALNPASLISKRIFFARRANQSLRSIVDILSSDLPVYSGSHLNFKPSTEASIEKQIAHILLRPGSEFNPDLFAQHLFTTRYFSTLLIGQTDTLNLIKPFLSSGNRALHDQSCLVLAEFRFDYNDCLHNILQAKETTDDLRRVATQVLQSLRESERQLTTYFLKDPMSWVRPTARSGEPGHILDVLRLLAQNPRNEIRDRACQLIKEKFPNDYQGNCLGL